jgi:MtrB/PioB family decaheme-associated outer membrane protein
VGALRAAAGLAVGALLALGLPSLAGAQPLPGGFTLEGVVETGWRFYLVEPSASRKAKLEEYRDLSEGPLLQDLQLRLSRDHHTVELESARWGRDDQEFALRVGRLGNWQLGFEWEQTPHVYSTTGRLLATEGPRGVFTLPTPRPALSDHNSAPRLDEIGLRWDTARLFGRWTPTPDLELTAEYTRTHKDGERPFSLGFGTSGNNFYEVLEPVRQTVHDVQLRAVLATERWQLQAGYGLSVFENGVTRLRADNPCFANPVACAPNDGGPTAPAAGQVSLPPDNMAHTLSLGGGISLPLRTRLNGNVTYSLRLQDEKFLPHTINPVFAGIPDLALPQSSLEGVVHTWRINVQATTRPFAPLTLSAKYRLYANDDRRDAITFGALVINDLVRAPARRAGGWSWQRQNADLEARLRVAQPLAVGLGVGWEYWDRAQRREVPESDEFFARGTLDVTPSDWLLARLTYTPSVRRINRYNTRADVQNSTVEDPALAQEGQSVLLRKFDEADRDRHKAELQLQVTPSSAFSVTPTLGYRHDDFVTSPLGLQHETAWSAGLDLAWTPLDWLALSAGYSYEHIQQRMRSRYRPPGGLDFADFDWVSVLTDTVHTLHAGLRATLRPRVLDLTLGASYASALGRTESRNPVPPVPHAGITPDDVSMATARSMPAFEDTLVRLEGALHYHFERNWTAKLGYVFESFEKSDWRTDKLQPWTPGQTSIWLGNDVRSYAAHILAVTLAYRFR